ncbi:MAG: RecX family transcriptional regulator [Acetobacteraceae bacterium]|nr:RecX family transcriptional regulator [Acetobacteraceae bacterium]
MPNRLPKPAGAVPDPHALREAALIYLARFAATEAGLIRVLDRRLERWARRAEAEGAEDVASQAAAARAQAREVARDLARAGAVNDAAFAGARARSLARAGRSRRAVAAHLSAKGVPAGIAAASLPPPEQELAQALAYARRRRLGPFRAAGGAPTAEQERRELASLARAGFPPGVAIRALRADPDEAEALVSALRRE